jgi:fused signal recognition particle receptor
MGFFNIFKKKKKEDVIEQELNENNEINSQEELFEDDKIDDTDDNSEENSSLVDDFSELAEAFVEEVDKKEDLFDEEDIKDEIDDTPVDIDKNIEEELVEEINEEENESYKTDETLDDKEQDIDTDDTEVISDKEDQEENDDIIESNEEKIQQPAKEKKGIFSRLRKGLSKTSDKLVGGMGNIFLGKKTIDDDLLDELEELFISADIGVSTTIKIIDEVRDEVSRKVLKNPEDLKKALKKKLFDILNVDNSLVQTEDRPYVVLVIGVNGAGKTTSIAKLANMFKNEGLKTVLAAGDTFRAAAIDQLKVWADRVGVPVIAQKEGSDPAAVIFDALQSAKAKKYDVMIADTAGRLHTKYNLMNELEKVVRIMKRELPDAPHEFLLVLDATSGQNAVTQAKVFSKDIGATGIILTKLDGTAKGGVIVSIVDELKIPVKFIGFGEGMDDLRPFNAKDFVDALFGDDE